MRVLHVLDRSLPVVAGYTSRSAAILAHQALLGFSPFAVTSVRHESSVETFERIGSVVIHRTPPQRLPLALRRAPVSREVSEMVTLCRRIQRIACATPPTIIHAHSPVLCGIPAFAAARRIGVPHVYEIRAFWEDAAQNQGRAGRVRHATTRKIETMLCMYADAVVTICDGIRRELIARGVPDERITVVPNGVDTERFGPLPYDVAMANELGLGSALVVGYIGSLFRFEGISLLLRALRRIVDQRPHVRGLIVGAGEVESEIRTLCSSLGLEQHVVIKGQTPPASVARLYSICDVLCYPRERHAITEKTTPLKPLEAMSMGKAVVASDVGGHRELIDNETNGLLFKAGDEADLSRQLVRTLDDDALRSRLGSEARQFVERERQWRALVARYGDVYAAAAARRARGRGAQPTL